MQEQNKLTACIPIPLELMEEVGLGPKDAIQMTAEDGCIIIERMEGPQVPGFPDSAKQQDKELYQYIDALTPIKKHKALVYLTLLWAERQIDHFDLFDDEDEE